MARKRKTSPVEDMLDLVSLLPWWAGVAIAVVGYVVLHRMATPVQIAPVQPGQVGNIMTQSVIAGLATAGQYIVPLVGLVGAVMSFFRRRQRATLVTVVPNFRYAEAFGNWTESIKVKLQPLGTNTKATAFYKPATAPSLRGSAAPSITPLGWRTRAPA